MANFEEFLKENKPEECQACGGALTLEKVNLEDYQGGKLYLMEKVPAFVCQECGEVWVPEPVMLEFEKMIEITKKHRKSPASAQRASVGKRKRVKKKKR